MNSWIGSKPVRTWIYFKNGNQISEFFKNFRWIASKPSHQIFKKRSQSGSHTLVKQDLNKNLGHLTNMHSYFLEVNTFPRKEKQEFTYICIYTNFL
jgi:hypothetical protein